MIYQNIIFTFDPRLPQRGNNQQSDVELWGFRDPFYSLNDAPTTKEMVIINN
jgi:hypothetical protein